MTAQPDHFGTGIPADASDSFVPLETLSYEQARDELINTVKILELGQMSLDESLTYWERGEALARRCEDLLRGAQARVETVLAQAESETPARTTDSENAS